MNGLAADLKNRSFVIVDKTKIGNSFSQHSRLSNIRRIKNKLDKWKKKHLTESLLQT